MNSSEPACTIPDLGPDVYGRWRASEIGAITERLERQLILELVGDVRGRRILDVGCGDGEFALELTRRGAIVTGIDASVAMVDAASIVASAGLIFAGSLAASAADLRANPVYKAPVRAPVVAWTGCYVGGQVGYGAGSSSPTWANGLPPGTPLTNRLDVNGVLGGITVGCNYQWARDWVVGVEGDYSWADKHDGSPLAPPGNPNHTFSVRESSLATARLRLGYAVDRWLLFVAGGAAWARVNATDVNNGTCV